MAITTKKKRIQKKIKRKEVGINLASMIATIEPMPATFELMPTPESMPIQEEEQ
jgi:hypothetical protein